MLAPKEISNKKLKVYIAIIVLMISSTAFLLLYQSKGPTLQKPAASGEFIDFSDQAPAAAAAVGSGNISASALANNQAGAQFSQTFDINKIKQLGGLDLTIFSSDKFKKLEDYSLTVEEKPEVGKKDPFQIN